MLFEDTIVLCFEGVAHLASFFPTDGCARQKLVSTESFLCGRPLQKQRHGAVLPFDQRKVLQIFVAQIPATLVEV